MTERIKLEEYLDMLIYQSNSNELKAGSSADSVADKLRHIKSQILQDYEIVNRLNGRLESISNQMKSESGNPNSLGIYRELRKIRDGK